MNLVDVMDELGAKLATLPGLRAFGYPPDTITPPTVVATYPDSYDFDATYGRGADRMVVPVVLLVGRASDRTSRDQLSAWMDNCGGLRYRIDKTAQLTRRTFSNDGALATSAAILGANPAQTGQVQFTLTGGTSQGISQLRDAWVRQDVTLSDFHARTTFDPPFYGDPDAGGPLNPITPQCGLVLRYQRDTKQRGVIVDTNIVFGFPGLLIGVWQANLDGTGFVNRQYPVFWPPPLGLALPYTVEVRLTGNTIRVRQWRKDVATNAPSWDDPSLAITLNLDTDCGDSVAIPTPVGAGSPGLLAAHIGSDTSPLSACRYRLADTFFEAEAPSLKAFIEAQHYASFDACRVMEADFDIVRIQNIDYVAAVLSIDVIGNGE